MRAHRVLGFLLFGGSVWAQQYVISTIAGGAPPATPLTRNQRLRRRSDADGRGRGGNVYFSSLHSVFKVDANGTMTRFAGNGRAGNSGDGGPATAAQLSFPMGIAIDAAGNVFVADRDASVVRRIAANGIITTVAGTGTAGLRGRRRAGGERAAQRTRSAVAVDASWQPLHRRHREPVSPQGIDGRHDLDRTRATARADITGDGGAARNAWFNGPEGVAVDGDGNLYIADTFNGRIRRVAADGTITTVAGVGSTGIFSRR